MHQIKIVTIKSNTNFTFQIQVTSPVYYSGISRFRFSFIDVSVQIPIEF
ncbi:hypothetical protein P3G55_17845 [Leptospira sp. 96542]|nr:hypothetical protein [Leptospira sp. 96542]